MILFRAKAYVVLGLPKRPKVHVNVLFGPWRDREPPAWLLAQVMQREYPQYISNVQKAVVT